MKIGEKIRLFAKENYGSLKKMADSLGMSAPQLSMYAAGTRNPGADVLIRLQSIGCDINWLLNEDAIELPKKQQNEADMPSIVNTPNVSSDSSFLEAKTAHDRGHIPPGLEGLPGNDLWLPMLKIPVISTVGAGTVWDHEIPLEEGVFEYLAAEPDLTGDLYAVKVHGDSMEPRIYEGDTLAIKPLDPALIVSGHDYVVVTDDGPKVKKVLITGASYVLRSYNPIYNDERVTKIYKAFHIARIVARYRVN